MDQLKEKLQKAIDYLHEEYGKLQTGRANAALVESLMVESYGSKMPLKGLATITIPESNQIMIQPWNRDQLVSVEKAIKESNLGFNPQNDGVVIRIVLPQLTEERRRDLVKLVHKYAEDARISVRNARHELLNEYKQMQKDGDMSEDELAGREKEIQKVVDEYNQKIEDSAKKKETDVMTV